MSDTIETDRLSLVPMSATFLEASLRDDHDVAEALVDARLPAEWPDQCHWLEIRHRQLLEHPDWAPWLTRLSILRATRQVIGVVGFHGPPGGEWLADIAPGGVEFGYTTYVDWRRSGYAYEACAALIRWAAERSVDVFVLSISTDNMLSRSLALKLGFSHAGQWLHEERGLEDVYRLQL